MVSEPSTTPYPSITVSILSTDFKPRVLPPSILTLNQALANEEQLLEISLTAKFQSSSMSISLVKAMTCLLKPGETLVLRRSDSVDQASPSPSTSSKSDAHSDLSRRLQSFLTMQET